MVADRRLEMQVGEDGPELRRTAHSPEGRERLQREIRRLTAGAHPGIVTLLRHDDHELTLAWAGDATLEMIRPGVGASAAIMASVAATVADLHRVGIVHGRLDPSHVVIGADGRPRLCGLRGVDPDEPEPAPTDDVAALGHLLERLVRGESELEPIPERRWGRRRWKGYERRALQTIADRATDPDPARRPTASALAGAITDAVPGAAFEPTGVPADDGPEQPEPLRSAPHDEPSAPTASNDAASPENPIASDDGGRPAPAFDPVRTDGPRVEAATEPTASPHESAARSTHDELRLPDGGDLDRYPSPVPEPFGPPPGWSSVPERPMSVDEPFPISDPDESAAEAPPRPEPHPAGSPGRRILIGAFGGLAVVLLAFGSLQMTSAGPGPAPIAGERSSPSPEAEVDPLSDCDGAVGDHDDCSDPVTVDGNTVIAHGLRYRVGEPGDRIRVADWNCDGSTTVALVRPATGEVFAFSDWAESDEVVSVDPVAIVTDAVDLIPPPDEDCQVRVRRRDGGSVAIDMEGST